MGLVARPLLLLPSEMYGKRKLNLYTDLKDVLKNISQEQVLLHEFNIDPDQVGTRISSPFREDKNPSCAIYNNNGKYILYDFTTRERLDIIDMVRKKYNCDNTAAVDIILNGSKGFTPRSTTYTKREPKKRIADFKPVIRPFNKRDLDFWGSFGITKDTLLHFKVYPLEKLFYKKFEGDDYQVLYDVKNTSEQDLAYCYLFNVEGKEKYKFYFPFREKGRKFLGNISKDIIQGMEQLPEKGKLLVITKSLKDVMALYEHKITAIAPHGEGYVLDTEFVATLKTKFPKIVSLYDFDRTGVAGANRLRKDYDIEPYFFTDGRFGTVDYKAKDFSDYIKQKKNENNQNSNSTSRKT